MKLIREFVSWISSTRAKRAAALDHEFRDHAMKTESIVKRPLGFLARPRIGEFLRAFREPDKIRDGFWGFLFKQLADDISLRSFKRRVNTRRACHSMDSPCRRVGARKLSRTARGEANATTVASYQPMRLRSEVMCAA